jgi:hypothetical protein
LVTLEFEAPKVDGIGAAALAWAKKEVLGNMMAAVLVLLNSFRKTVGGRGTGRTYRRGKRGRVHQASAPGQPPARDYGDYVNSFDFSVEETADEVRGHVGSRMWATRGIHLELGTSRMRPRPHVDQSINAARAGVEQALTK